MKVFHAAHLEERARVLARRELLHLHRFKHENIVAVVGVNLEPPSLYIVTELVPQGSVRNLLDARSPDLLLLEARLRLALDMLEGLAYIHGQGYTHGDIKCANLLVDGALRGKLADFGLAAAREELARVTQRPISLAWCPPEVLDEKPYTSASEVYAAAMGVYELLSFRQPFHGLPATSVMARYGLLFSYFVCDSHIVPRAA